MILSITQKQNAAAVITNSKRKFNSNTHTYIHVCTPKINYIQNQYPLVYHQMNHYDTTSFQTKTRQIRDKGKAQSKQTTHTLVTTTTAPPPSTTATAAAAHEVNKVNIVNKVNNKLNTQTHYNISI
jgi:hypothetical protein